MKASIYLIVLAALLLGACSKSNGTAKTTLATPVQGMRVDEVVAGHNVAAELLPARQSRQRDSGMQAAAQQMALVASDLDARMRLLTANAGAKVTVAKGPADSVGVLDPQIKLQLDANLADMLSHVAEARAAIDGVGGSQDMVAGMPAKSVRDGLHASLTSIESQINEIGRASHTQAIAQVADLRTRLDLKAIRNLNPPTPTISVRVTH